MVNELASLRLKDLEIFAEVARARSIREVARRTGSTPGQISKVIQNFEGRLGVKLFRRSASGVLLSNQGAELLSLVQALLETGEKIERIVSGKSQRFEKSVAIAGTSFLNSHFVIPAVCRVFGTEEGTAFRFLDLAPDQIMAVGLRGGFEMAVYYGTLSWPGTWASRRLGKSKWDLCVRAGHPLATRSTLKQVLEYPFILPAYWTAEGLARGNDQFPLSTSKRKVGFETATADAAVPILLRTDQVAFLPEILTRSFVEAGQLRVLKVKGVPLVEKEIFLSVKTDVVSASIFQKLVQEMSGELK